MVRRMTESRSVWLLGLAAAGMVYVGIALLQLPPHLIALLQSLVYLVFPAIATFAVVKAIRCAPLADRRAFAALGLGLGFIFIGETLWAAGQVFVDASGPQGLSIADIGLVPGYLLILVFVGLVLFDRFGAASTLDRSLYTIDGLMGLGVAGSLMFLLVVEPLFALGQRPALSDYLYLGYAYTGVIAVTGLVGAIAISGSGWRSWEARITVGLGINASADLVFDFFLAARSYGAGDVASALVDVAWMTGYFMIAAGAFSYVRHEHELAVPRQARSKPISFADLLPVGLAAVMVPLMMRHAVEHARHGNEYAYWVGAATLLSLLVVARAAVLTISHRELVERSTSDPLTGLYNHREFHERLRVETERARRNGDLLSVILVDLDDFRHINDTRGHLAGDRRLIVVGASIREALRTGDIPCRVGGDEFAAILPGAGRFDAVKVCSRIATRLIANQHGEDAPTTASIGVAVYPLDAPEKMGLIAAADAALYCAKDTGRDCAVVFEPALMSDDDTALRVVTTERQVRLNTAVMVAAAIDRLQGRGHPHSEQTSSLAVRLGALLGLEDVDLGRLRQAGLLHSIGRIGVPESVLASSDHLNDPVSAREYNYPGHARRLLHGAVDREVVECICALQEHWDGNGFPRGLERDAIPLAARIIAICGAFDSLMNPEHRSPGVDCEQAYAEIALQSGSRFDPSLIALFERVARESTGLQASQWRGSNAQPGAYDVY